MQYYVKYFGSCCLLNIWYSEYCLHNYIINTLLITGKKLGSGACGSVHELHQEGSTKYNNDWAIKLAPLPKSKAKSGKGKRKKTAEERNADLIQHENLTLQNAGSDMRGRLVPDIPYLGSPPAFGETSDGGKFIFI